MANTTQEIFSVTAPAELATEGTYGLAPTGYRLPAGTRLGRVVLVIADLTRSLAFYEQTLGLSVIGRGNDWATLGAHDDAQVLVELREQKGIKPARRGLLGLFHFAVLLPDRPSLGRFVRHLADIGVRAGAGDHLVSEAFYLTDPDGLGIEVYADRPRSEWRRIGRELMISTDPVDVADVVNAAGEDAWSGMPPGTRIGHVHLHVGDLETGAAFFSEAIGFDRMTWNYSGALFLGADGYHHHLGTNIWAGASARPAGVDEARLREWTIELPAAADIAAVEQSLRASRYPAETAEQHQLLTRDPWGTHIRLRVQGDTR